MNNTGFAGEGRYSRNRDNNSEGFGNTSSGIEIYPVNSELGKTKNKFVCAQRVIVFDILAVSTSTMCEHVK